MPIGNETRFQAQISIDYPNIIERGAIGRLGQHLSRIVTPDRPLAIISDDVVARVHYERVCSALALTGRKEVPLFSFPAGEDSKSQETHDRLVSELLDAGIHRRCVLLALGGGVVCDTVGYLAATYMRGVDYINLPTSLIAQVDAGFGGKVAVNTPQCKNLVGAFWHPIAVIVDPNLLATLPKVEVQNGLAEAVKVAMIHSPDLFEYMEETGEVLVRGGYANEAIDSVISEAVRGKIELLLPDPFERDLRRVLNFGHTFAHPLEVAAGSSLRHGFAVSIGMSIATRVALIRQCIRRDDAQRLFDLLNRFGLPVDPPQIDPLRIWEHTAAVTQIRGNHIHFVLPTAIGSVRIVDDLTRDEFLEAYRFTSGSASMFLEPVTTRQIEIR